MERDIKKIYEKYASSEEGFTQTYIDNTQNRIYALMEKENVKQNKLAEDAKISPQQLNGVLKRGHNATLKTIGKIAYALKVKAVNCFVSKKWNDVLFRQLIEEMDKHVNDVEFYNYLGSYTLNNRLLYNVSSPNYPFHTSKVNLSSPQIKQKRYTDQAVTMSNSEKKVYSFQKTN